MEKDKSFILKHKWASAIPFICTIVYFVLGYILEKKGVEHPYLCSLPVFLIIPFDYVIVGLKKPTISYPALITIIYLVVCATLQISIGNGYWHPLWVIFLTIPIYYIFYGNRKIGEKDNKNKIDYDIDDYESK